SLNLLSAVNACSNKLRSVKPTSPLSRFHFRPVRTIRNLLPAQAIVPGALLLELSTAGFQLVETSLLRSVTRLVLHSPHPGSHWFPDRVTLLPVQPDPHPQPPRRSHVGHRSCVDTRRLEVARFSPRLLPAVECSP